MNLVKKILIVVLFLVPLGETIRLNFGNGVFIKPVDVGIVLMSTLWLIFKFANKEEVKGKNIYIPILLFTGLGILSLLINFFTLTISQFFISLMYLVRWIAYTVVFFVVCDFDKDFKKIISKVLIIVGSLTVGLGYLQYVFYPNLRNLYYLGWDEHMYRMFSVFLDPNLAGAFFVLFFLFLINKFFKKKKLAIGLLALFTLGAVFLTFSRSALIMLIVSSSLLFILMNKKIGISLLLSVTVIVLVISSKYFDIENMNLFRVVSSEARIATARNAIKIIRDHLIFGVGFNSYRYAQLRYGFSNEINVVSHADAGTDNSFLFIIATTGIVGFILYLFLWFRIFKIASVLTVASITGVFVNSLFINSLFYPFIMLWLWVIIGVNSSADLKLKGNK